MVPLRWEELVLPIFCLLKIRIISLIAAAMPREK